MSTNSKLSPIHLQEPKNHFHKFNNSFIVKKIIQIQSTRCRQMLRGEIATLDHYHPLGGKTKGQS